MYCSLFICENGEVYSCGWGADGQTGLGHFNSEWQPSRVTGDIVGETIVKVSCVSDCVLALNGETSLMLLLNEWLSGKRITFHVLQLV